MPTEKDTYFFAYGAGVSEFKCYLIHKGVRLLSIDVKENKVFVKGKELSPEKFCNLLKLVK